ncbi:TonB-dependent receptor [Marinimicrobium alkaliphilum]|uniref:TonB-dependent receptor n=1 Tax=Marinimicrobium alkaliphilum TaxID=2202654 RepID=UPI000DBA25EA|nr:TonB-dependent receptor [Marinimicrobium alkaliphilum]
MKQEPAHHPLLGLPVALPHLFLLCLSAPTLAGHQDTGPLDTITVTGTRAQSTIGNTSASVGVIDRQTLEDLHATHAADALNRIPGVNIVQLGSSGPGVSASIRQPITTGPVYLYLENGVPTRSPVFFNHNALYEINLAQADGVEVIKGPGSALYGSDAIGGVINVLSNRPIEHDALALTLEGGDFGWRRAQVRGQAVRGGQHLAVRLEASASDGWRDHTDYDRQAGNLVWQTGIAGFDVNTVYSGARLDMASGGSGLNAEDFENNPSRAGNVVGYRDVSSQRLSSAWQRPAGTGELTVTPYWRENRLEYLATWTLNTGREVYIPWRDIWALDSQDAHINRSDDRSLGLQSQYRQDVEWLDQGFWIAGIDLDLSQGNTRQTYIERTDNDPGDYWLAYQPVRPLYDYRVSVRSASPYLHWEADLHPRWRVDLGLRYDWLEYDYTSRIGADPEHPTHRRPEDRVLSMDRLSPKAGAIFRVSEELNAFAAWRRAFRVPSESQLFRSGATADSTDLEPVVADSKEVGLRGRLNSAWRFEATLYWLEKYNDILAVTEATGTRRQVNAGETRHRGLELGTDLDLARHLTLGVSWTRADHEYRQWQDSDTDYAGHQLPNAPRSYGNVRLEYRAPWLNGGRLEAEWLRQGRHFIDEANTLTYDGYQLLNLRANYRFDSGLDVYLQGYNLGDTRYAETTGRWGPIYTPGRPRTLIAGINFAFD